MNTENYIIVSKSSNKSSLNDKHTDLSCLGHEIHLTRFVLFGLLEKNKNILNSTIVTISTDRFFLYNKTFQNVITWEDYVNNKKNNNTTEFDLTNYMLKLFYNTENNEFFKINNTFNFNLNLFERTEEFNNNINALNFYDLTSNLVYSDIIKEKFVVIHFRTLTSDIPKENQDILVKIINKLKEKFNLKIVVFSGENININLENVYFINNLQVYASFLNNTNCNLLISEWSGGGQLSQYCFNSKVIYYFHHYPSLDYEIHYKSYQTGADLKNNIMGFWDFKSTTNCERFYYKTIDLMLENI